MKSHPGASPLGAVLAAAVQRHRLAAHLIVPALASLVLMGLYFSGSPPLQGIVAPTIEGMHPFTWREFGALEWLQNVVLVSIVAVLASSLRLAPSGTFRLALAGLAGLFVFVLLEEVDYGAHLAEWLGAERGSLDAESWDRNLHNRQTASGVQYGSYMRTAATAAVVVWFVAAPLLLRRVRSPAVGRVLPSLWMILTVALMAAVSWLAHGLDDAGLAVIDGVPGNLEKNISEFRELTLYYAFALYFLELKGRLSDLSV